MEAKLYQELHALDHETNGIDSLEQYEIPATVIDRLNLFNVTLRRINHELRRAQEAIAKEAESARHSWLEEIEEFRSKVLMYIQKETCIYSLKLSAVEKGTPQSPCSTGCRPTRAESRPSDIVRVVLRKPRALISQFLWIS